MAVAEQLERLAGVRDRWFPVPDESLSLRLLDPELREVDRLRARPEKALGQLEMPAATVGVSLRTHDPSGEQVSAGEVQAVLGRLEERDCAPHIVQGCDVLSLELG